MENALTWMSHRSLVPFPSEEGIDVNFFFNSPEVFGAVITGLRRGLGVVLLSISAVRRCGDSFGSHHMVR